MDLKQQTPLKHQINNHLPKLMQLQIKELQTSK